MVDRFATLPPAMMAAPLMMDVDEARREWVRPDGIIWIGEGTFGCTRYRTSQPAPTRVLDVPWPFSLGPNGALFVLLAMEAPFIAALLLKAAGY